MIRSVYIGGLALLLVGCWSAEYNQAGAQALPACEWCGTAEAPDELDWQTTIAGPNEPGEALVITGVVYQADGETPAPDIVLYLYHTNADGLYPKRGDETGNAQRHGYLRAWLKTNADGQYQFTTIRPGSYPTRTEPAHIHMTVKEPGKDEYWIDTIHFVGDPLLTEEDRESDGLITVQQDAEGVWHGQRDIILKP